MSEAVLKNSRCKYLLYQLNLKSGSYQFQGASKLCNSVLEFRPVEDISCECQGSDIPMFALIALKRLRAQFEYDPNAE